MKNFKKMFIFTIFISLLFSFNIFAMSNFNDPERPSPRNEKWYDDRSLNNRWTWLNDNSCVRFNLPENAKKYDVEKRFNMGALSQWAENGTTEKANVVSRETYSGKWSQSSEGIWSFAFDDCTIPVGVTKIDGVLYAFNTYGELKAGYEYYDGLKTDADGLVKTDNAEFTQWLATQYLPECTSHE
jgi:hypothetical protein